MANWSTEQLTTLGDAEEIRIGTMRGGRLVSVPIWIVRLGPELYVRSYRGPQARWFTRATEQGHAVIQADGTRCDVSVEPVGSRRQEQIDQAYREKYGHYGASYIEPMTSSAVVETTLRLSPR